MNTAATAHGMDGTVVKADWPPLALRELRLLFECFSDFVAPVEILSASPRPFSAASVVKIGAHKVFVKRHHRTVRNREGLLEEHRFMDHLRRNGAAVPRVLATAKGESAIEIGEWTYEVHEGPAGVDLYEDAVSWTPFRSAAHARAAGKALASLHAAAQGFEAPVRKVQPLVASFSIFSGGDPAGAIKRYCADRLALRDHAETRRHCDAALELLAPFHAELLPLLPALRPLWTHNDLHASNLFWTDTSLDAQSTAIIDFGLADRTNALHDLAHALERNMVEWLELVRDPAHLESVPVHLDHAFALLEGYEAVRRLSEEEAAALAPMLALCHAEFALTEADYFLGILHSEERARMATDGYLVGHARWFRSKSGECLLNSLREWSGARSQRKDGSQ
jgi:Ser/Thr protein kinase RdoA (MazF antagonist)